MAKTVLTKEQRKALGLPPRDIRPGDRFHRWPSRRAEFKALRRRERKSVDWLRARYLETANPYYVACAFFDCLNARLPDWILRYLELAFGNILYLTSGPQTIRVTRGDAKPSKYQFSTPQKRQIAPAIAQAFGFCPGGVKEADRKLRWPGDPRLKTRKKVGRFNPLEVRDPYLELASATWMELSAGKTRNAAYDVIARRKNSSRRNVIRAWKKYEDHFSLEGTHYAPKQPAKVSRSGAKK